MASGHLCLTFADECPDGWEFGPDNETCYRFVTEPSSWLGARYQCDNYDEGDLVIITDQSEMDYISQRMATAGVNDTFWVGEYLSNVSAGVANLWSTDQMWRRCGTAPCGHYYATSPSTVVIDLAEGDQRSSKTYPSCWTPR